MTTDLFKGMSDADLIRYELITRRLARIDQARDDLLTYAKLQMPDPEDQDDPDKSLYHVAQHLKLIAEALERVARGEILRLAISMPPQHGKTELASRLFIAWFSGLFPRKHVIMGAYNADYATNKVGAKVRQYMQSPAHKAVFPDSALETGSQAKDHMTTTRGGELNFIGRGGAGTGMAADLVVLDDPLKNAEEANSATTLASLHEWYSKVILSRVRSTTAIIVIHTRWTEDDLIGRLCDPDHSDYDEEAAGDWTYLNIPAVVHDKKLADALGLKLERPTEKRVIDQFGAEPVATLWPEEFNLKKFAEAKRLDKMGFEALYQGNPTPDDGDYFKADGIIEHRNPSEYPEIDDLYFYGASDHALTEKEENDATCMGIAGVDRSDHIWVMPELVWDRFETDVLLDKMIYLMKLRQPMIWWAEEEHINKSLGPFRRKRQHEEKTYTLVEGLTSGRDLRARARPMQGRMAMGMVHFPAWMPWWPKAKAELLKFPRAKHDDFVSFLSLIGRGLDKEYGKGEKPKDGKIIRVGSLEWVKAEHNRRQRMEAGRKAAAGW